MSFKKRENDKLFNLHIVRSSFGQFVKTQPRLFCSNFRRSSKFVISLERRGLGTRKTCIASSLFVMCSFDKDDLVFPLVQFVADDKLMSVPFQRGAGFGDK